MTRVRYARSLRDLEVAKEKRLDPRPDAFRSIRCLYETDAEVAAAVVPKPLEPSLGAEVSVTISRISRHVTPDVVIESGTATLGVQVEYDAQPGIYFLTLPMTSERGVLSSRERYGLPAKLAEVVTDFGRDDLEAADRNQQLSASVTRKGVRFLSARARAIENLGADRSKRIGYCFKAFPGCTPTKGFDHDPQLLRLEWDVDASERWRLEGDLEFLDSAFDPVADLPVRRLIDFEYIVGQLRTSARVLRPVPGDWLLPFIHQRYDEPDVDGVEV